MVPGAAETEASQSMQAGKDGREAGGKGGVAAGGESNQTGLGAMVKDAGEGGGKGSLRPPAARPGGGAGDGGAFERDCEGGGKGKKRFLEVDEADSAGRGEKAGGKSWRAMPVIDGDIEELLKAGDNTVGCPRTHTLPSNTHVARCPFLP